MKVLMCRMTAVWALFCVAPIAASPSYGETVVKFDLGGSDASDVSFDGAALSTIDELNGSTTGDQDTGLLFVGSLEGQVPDVDSGASLTLAGITVAGQPQTLGPAISQATSGGQFWVYDDNDTLLLEGALGTGAINGSVGGTSGGFMTTSELQYTGGSLLSEVDSGSMSLSFTDVISDGSDGMLVTSQNSLAPFTAVATGQFDTSSATSVPEPTALPPLALLLGICGVSYYYRRRRAFMNKSFSAVTVGILAATLSCFLPGSATAGTILKVNFGDSEPDFGFDGSDFSTPDDSDASTLGLQNSMVLFSGPLLGEFADIHSGASLSIQGIATDGPVSTSGAMIAQPTMGGGFSIYDDMNDLLIAGTYSSAVLVGMSNSPTASFFTTGSVQYTSGWLLPELEPSSGSLSLSLGNVISGAQSGLQVNNGGLAPFTADATGSLGGIREVPEPASRVIFAGMAIGLGIWGNRRRARYRQGKQAERH